MAGNQLERPAPCSPEHFGDSVLPSRTFMNNADTSIVADLYTKTLPLVGILAGAERLKYERLGWGDAEAVHLASVLKYATKATRL
eukprot:2389315-Prymnesium_polylepis.1